MHSDKRDISAACFLQIWNTSLREEKNNESEEYATEITFALGFIRAAATTSPPAKTDRGAGGRYGLHYLHTRSTTKNVKKNFDLFNLVCGRL